jgi:hypothetical protein
LLGQSVSPVSWQTLLLAPIRDRFAELAWVEELAKTAIAIDADIATAR